MGRHTKNAPIYPGPWPCEFRCGAVLQSKTVRAEFEGWEWFCGYGDHPVHFCPKCFAAHRHDVETIRRRLDERPDGYHAVRLSSDAIVAGVLNRPQSRRLTPEKP